MQTVPTFEVSQVSRSLENAHAFLRAVRSSDLEIDIQPEVKQNESGDRDTTVIYNDTRLKYLFVVFYDDEDVISWSLPYNKPMRGGEFLWKGKICDNIRKMFQKAKVKVV